ncbi:type II toxin-antitoxin system VapC family toxin [Candidatus Thiosymbion oneisti]|uniref:type II toxin-antitoxin system VapC family toxin n=1 Tax=Candidatus Thiosymbion oneisti TaxID=589554 RepID=UPI000B7D751B|nr:type II toxin-antitoxin system VapC family toxin [Candidatus Thiosymbion oneisti]
MRLVLDASAAVRLVMRAEAADKLLEPVSAATVVIAPSLYASEVANALWKYVKAGSLEAETALGRYEEAINLIDDFTPDRELATEALTEAVRYRHPVYDLLYAVLARRTGGALLSMDQRLKTLLDRMGIDTISTAVPKYR